MFYIFLYNLLLLLSGVWCQDVQRLVVPQGEPFSFDCQQDDLVYFGRKINDWTEIQENNDNNLYLNLNFNYLTKENLLRITSDAAQSKHIGFYACRKPTWSSTSMNSVYQLILADVQSFYWNYICHGPIGSCQRSDDITDENSSRFEVADQTNIELFCCASVTGYNNVNILMTNIGDIRGSVEVNRKQELDGSWVVCANQRTILRRSSYGNQQTLTCDLLIDDRRHSTLSSVIIMKDAILPDPSSEYTFQTGETREDGYFNQQVPISARSRRKLSTGKKVAIILGSIVGGLLLLFGLAIVLIILIGRHKPASSSTTTKISKQYSPVRSSEQSRYLSQREDNDEEPIYEEPTQLSVETPVFMRC